MEPAGFDSQKVRIEIKNNEELLPYPNSLARNYTYTMPFWEVNAGESPVSWEQGGDVAVVLQNLGDGGDGNNIIFNASTFLGRNDTSDFFWSEDLNLRAKLHRPTRKKEEPPPSLHPFDA